MIGASALVSGILVAASTLPAAASTPDPPSEAFTAVWHPIVSTFGDGTDRETWWTVKASDDTVVCGKFDTIQSSTGQKMHRDSVYATSGVTGQPTDFAPVVKRGSGMGVVNKCIVSYDGNWLIMSGSFNLVNGVAVDSIARVNLGQMTVNGKTYQPGAYATKFGSANGAVTDLEKGHNHYFLFGSFTTVNGQPQVGIASLNKDGSFSNYFRSKLTGQITPTAGSTKSFRGAVSPNQKLMLAIVNTSHIDGQPRKQVAMWGLQKGHAKLLKWEPQKAWNTDCRHGKEYSVVRDVQFQGNHYASTGATGGPCNRALNDATIKFDVTQRGLHLKPVWSNITFGDTIWGLVVHKGVICASGHMKQTETAPGSRVMSYHNGIYCLNAANGHVLDWRSDQPRCVGGKSLAVIDGYLLAGTDCGDGLYARRWS
jgi:hypothetical protein